MVGNKYFSYVLHYGYVQKYYVIEILLSQLHFLKDH
jgi:hypothetical protein